MFIQPVRHLLSLYLLIAAVGVIVWSYILNEEYMKYCSELLILHSSLLREMFILNSKALQVFFFSYVSQTFLSIVFCFSTRNLPDFRPKNFLVGVLFIFPTLIKIVLPSRELTIVPFLTAVITFLFLLSYVLKYLTRVPNFLWVCITSRRFSFHITEILYSFTMTWSDLQVFEVLQVFGATRLIKDFTFLVYDNIFAEYYEFGTLSFSTKLILNIFKHLVIKSCDNLIAICGTASILSIFVNNVIYIQVLKFVTVPPDAINSISFILSLLLIIVSTTTGIPSLEPEQRFSSLTSIILLVILFVLNKIHVKICNLLQSLSVMGNSSYSRHARVLVSVFVILFICISWLIFLFKTHAYISSVHLIILNTEIIVSLLISMVIYILNLINLRSRTAWYELYDYVFYLESIKAGLHIVLGVIVMLSAIYSFYDYGSIVRMLFMCTHVYHNIWCVVTRLWNNLRERRTISLGVNSLPIASEEEIVIMGGLCAICYEDLRGHVARITRCNHFFHGYCLREWLFERKICPVCHRVILFTEQFQNRSNRQRAFHMHQD